jgi:hypothetical protein
MRSPFNFNKAFAGEKYAMSKENTMLSIKTTINLPEDYWDISPISEEDFVAYNTFETERIKDIIREIPAGMEELKSLHPETAVKNLNITIKQPGEKVSQVRFTKDKSLRNPGTRETYVADSCSILTKNLKSVYKETITDMLKDFD